MNPTPGSQWRKAREEGVTVTLPSGNVARLRPVYLDLIVKLGRVPDGLLQVALEALGGNGQMAIPVNQMADLQALTSFYDAVCECAFVEPKIVPNPKGEDEISVEDIELQDKTFIAQFINLPASQLATFHQKQNSHVEPVHPDAGHGAATEPTPAD